MKFVSDYREFIQLFGGAIVGPLPIYGLRRAEPMDIEIWSVISATMHYRNEGWPKSENIYVISSDHAGNPIGITIDGRVTSYDHDSCENIQVAESFEEFLNQCLND